MINLKQAFNVAKHFVVKYSPEILTGTGILLGAGAVVTTGIQSYKKVPEIKEHLDNKLYEIGDQIAEAEMAGDAEDINRGKLVFKAYVETIGEYAKAFALPAALSTGSVVSILCGMGILRKRYGVLSLAYASLETAYTKYREKVIDEYGIEKDREFRFGKGVTEKCTEYENDENTAKNDVQTTYNADETDTIGYSQYAVLFDESNMNWRKDASKNYMFLHEVQMRANRRLDIDGILFLNDLRKMMDMEPVKIGQLAGWVKNKGTEPTTFVDLGLFDNEGQLLPWIDPNERNAWIDPNCKEILTTAPILDM